MDPVSAILAALVAGATAAASATASQAVKDAYHGLKTILVDTYKLVSTSLLEQKPDSTVYREAVHSELKEHPALSADQAVLERAKAVQEALTQTSAAQTSASGV